MKKIYVLAPVVALGVFSAVWWNHGSAREARLAAHRGREEALRQQKLREAADARTKAMADATVAREARAREQAEKAQREERWKALRLAEEQRSLAAGAKAQALRTRLEQSRAELDRVEAGIARGEERARELGGEERFLADCVRRAEENRASYLALLERFEAAERASAAAASNPPAGSRDRAPRQKG